MIKSMTGYGSAKGNAAGFEISVELKSVNNRYLETSVRMPRSFLFAEEAVKSTVQRHISRGKVDVFINVSAVGVDDVKVSVNEAAPSTGHLRISSAQSSDSRARVTRPLSTSVGFGPNALETPETGASTESVTVCGFRVVFTTRIHVAFLYFQTRTGTARVAPETFGGKPSDNMTGMYFATSLTVPFTWLQWRSNSPGDFILRRI